MLVCVDVIVMSSAYNITCTGAVGVLLVVLGGHQCTSEE